MSKSTAIWLTILSVILIDQVLKFYIKTTIHYGDGFDILGLSWAKIHFVENKGMAFGLSFGGEIGKYALSIFRIIMTFFLIYLIRGLLKQGESYGLLISFSLVIAGAIGNSIDGMFYGVIFSESYFHGGLATLFPPEGGYSGFLQGKVVDMFYFPLFNTVWPEWVPFVGGNSFEFFRHVFNVADSAITVGVVSMLLFHRRFFMQSTDEKKVDNPLDPPLI